MNQRSLRLVLLELLAIVSLLSTAPAIADESDFDEYYWENLAPVVEFHIKDGTGMGPWNTRENPVEVKVGDILRLVNDDKIAHYLHTFGAPCIHGTKKFGPSETYDCKVIKEADLDKDVCYDHQFGSKSRFWVKATK